MASAQDASKSVDGQGTGQQQESVLDSSTGDGGTGDAADQNGAEDVGSFHGWIVAVSAHWTRINCCLRDHSFL